jgi:DNA-directed RNA polymerase beta subunit
MPIIVGSNLCVTSNATRETKKQLKEDPNDAGGYFIINGMEWAVNNLESTTYNTFNVFKNMYGNEIARGTFLSKPGDYFENSYQIILKLLNTGAITLELPSKGSKDVITLPFYLVFRAFGMTRDKEIVNNIVYGITDDAITRDMMAVLLKAFSVDAGPYEAIRKSINPVEVVAHIASINIPVANPQYIQTDENIEKYMNEQVYVILDRFILPHIGTDSEHRIRKLKYLGHLINKLISVSMDIIEPTDRDSYSNKRLHAAGTSLSKSFKTHFNFVVSHEIVSHLAKDFQSNSFSQVNLEESVKAAIKAEDLDKALIQSITAGNKVINIKRTEIVNRVPSENLHRKNDMNTKAIANQINTPDTTASKQNERADEMRRVHPTFIGYVDITQSADSGEKVGMSKQMACSASICGASSSWILKKKLEEDSDVINIMKILPEEIKEKKYAKVFVNGDWIGCTTSAHNLVTKYRQIRREGGIDHEVTIIWHPFIREVYFWTDVGRLHRPLVIVYNNLQEYIDGCRSGKRVPFKQWIKLTKRHIRGLQAKKITMDDLRRENVIEYISPGEQENCYLAMDIGTLRGHANNIEYRYTHCDIAQAIFGIVSLASPLPNHSNPTRITYYTNHRKQSLGWFVLNYPYRIDKLTSLQHYCERPLVSTFSDSITYPYGHNCIIALAIYGGFNQEDSIIVNQNSVDCGMFNATFYFYQSSELDNGEQFGNPDPLRTQGVRKDRVYEYIEDKFIKKGTIIHKNYVLAIKVVKKNKPDDYLYVDRSIVYNRDEPAYVERIVQSRNDNDMPVVKIKYRMNRPLRMGDKLSSRSGNKGIVSKMYSRHDMMYFEDGLRVDAIVNPHSIPTRMAVNQPIECALGILCAKIGCSINATAFEPVNLPEIIEKLAKFGHKYGGHRRAFNGMTGEWFDTLIFVGPTTYQRPDKYVADVQHAAEDGATNAVTRQPVDGKANNGGIRIGEMEKDVLAAHGTMTFTAEKWYKDSDEFDRYVCRNCKNIAIVNEDLGLYRCKYCGDDADIAKVASTWCANQFDHYIRPMNIKMLYELEPYTYSCVEDDTS